jgi:hypothetical protein
MGTVLYPPLYPELLPLEYHNEHLHWLQIKDTEETGYHESMAPRKYKIIDYQDGVPQFQAIVTQKNQVGQPHPPFSTVTIHSYELLEMINTKILSFPDIRKMILLYPPHHRGHAHLGGIAKAIRILLEGFDTLQSLILPIDFMAYLSIPVALEEHFGLIQLELVLATTSPMRSQLGLAIVLGLNELRDRIQKLIIPASILSPDLLRFLGCMDNLKHLEIKSVGGSGGNRFVDMISEYGISSEHAFHALRILDVGAKYTHPSKLCVLWRNFPDVQYL